MFNIVIFNSENELLLSDVQKECQKEKWIPIACQEENEKKTIFLFDNFETAKNFVKRNFLKGEFIGLVLLHEIEIEKLKNNYYLEKLSWPKKIKNINFEIFYLEENPSLVINNNK
jgi:hypothetical protein